MSAAPPPSTAIVLLAAVADNGVIGRDNALPFRQCSDLKRFKSLTMGKPVLMGRKTYQSIGKALPERTNIVMSRSAEFSPVDCVVVATLDEARALCHRTIADGSALERFRRVVEAQGGDPRSIDDLSRLPQPRRRVPIAADHSGVVRSLHARPIGHATMLLGAGRARVDSTIDPAVGVILHKKLGDTVAKGERVGLIKFGSRVDIFLGPAWEIKVRPGERVAGGSSIIARRREPARSS